MRLALALKFLAAYRRARRFDRLQDRAALEAVQGAWLERLQREVSRQSAFYRPYARTAWSEWPVIDKAGWMKHFDAINTVHARLEEISEIALRAERTRDFSLHWRDHTVGMSTGTSGNRGIFLASPQEGALWAGTLLGKLLPGGLLARERVALVLRAGATLYDAIGALRLRFRFFDQARPWQEMADDLRTFDPTILIAPASALRLLADAGDTLKPRRVISVAEVLDDLDRRRIERGFGVMVEQIYQATEGLLGMSCEHGTVHLNEPYILVEPQWEDAEHTRFVPLVTDLWRRAQPVIRYRLNDVLQVRRSACPCGRSAMGLAAIEGRTDDILWLDGRPEPVAMFPDLLTRAIVTCLPEAQDFRLTEHARGRWSLAVSPMPQEAQRQEVASALRALAQRRGAAPPELMFTQLAPPQKPGKQRRVLGMRSSGCAF